jgi:MFS family permease
MHIDEGTWLRFPSNLSPPHVQIEEPGACLQTRCRIGSMRRGALADEQGEKLSPCLRLRSQEQAVIGFASIPIIKEFHLTPVQYGFIGGAFYWFFSISAFVVATISDRVGPKRVLASLGVVWALSQFTILFVTAFPLLVLARVLLGAGEGPSLPTSLNAASQWLPQEHRALAFSAVLFGGAIGPAVFVSLLVWLITSFGWRAAFGTLGGIGLVWVILWLIIGRDSPSEVGLAEEESQVAPVARRRVAWAQLVPILLSRNFICTMLVLFVGYWVLGILISWVPPYLTLVYHLEGATYSLVAAIPWIVLACSEIIFSAISDFFFFSSDRSADHDARCQVYSSVRARAWWEESTDCFRGRGPRQCPCTNHARCLH